MNPSIPLFIPVDVGTDYAQRLVLNPLFVLLAGAQMRSMVRLAEVFGLSKKEEQK